MKISRFLSSGGYLVNLLLIMVMLVGCTLSDDENVLKSDSINDSDYVSADFRSIEDNPQLMEEFRNNLEKSLSNKSTFQETENLLKSNKKWVSKVHASGNMNLGHSYSNNTPLFQSEYYISLDAKRSQDGEVVGVIRFKDIGGKTIGYADIICLDVRGKYAFIGFYVGANQYHIGFEDNGEGSKSIPDRYTNFHIPPGNVYCNIFATYIMNTIFSPPEAYAYYFKYDWEKGNVQIN